MRKLIFTLFLLATFSGYSQTRYVSVSGAGAHDGTSEANAWTLSEALANDAPGMTIYVKAGNYGAGTFAFTTSGTAANPIKYIGYVTTPGDVDATNGSTFTRGGAVSSVAMPLVARSVDTGYCMTVSASWVEIHNFQLHRGKYGIIISGTDNVFDNVIASDQGNQSTNGGASGTGFYLQSGAHRTQLLNCFADNSQSNGFLIQGPDDVYINYSEAHCDNNGAAMGYYFILSNGSEGAVIENSIAYRGPSVFAHGGHGFDLKDLTSNNIVRNCTTYRTSLEVNFSGVTNNLFENCSIYGDTSADLSWAARIFAANGANQNTFRNIYIEDATSAIQFSDYEDGYVGPGGDRDLDSLANYNDFENIIVNGASRLFETQYAPGGSSSSVGTGNTFKNITLYNVDDLATVSNPLTGWEFYNVGVHTASASNAFITINNTSPAAGSVSGFTYSNNYYYNSNNTGYPAGWTSSTDPLLVSAGTSGESNYAITTGSPWIDAGSTVNGTTTDFNGDSPNGARDVGAFEFNGAAGGGDVTPPSVSSFTVTSTTVNSFTVDWNVDEASKGRIYFDTDTGTVAGDYASNTVLESNFLTRHIQTPGPGNPSALAENTTYYWRIYTEDAAGNSQLSAEQTTTTLSSGTPPDPPTSEVSYGEGVRGRMLKAKKF